MPPPLHVCNVLASPVDGVCRMYCKMSEVICYAAAPVLLIQTFCRILLSSPWYNFTQNVISSSIDGSDYLHSVSSNSVQYLRKVNNADVGTGHVDNGTQ